MLEYLNYGYLLSFIFLFAALYYLRVQSKKLNNNLKVDYIMLSVLGFMILYSIYEASSYEELAKKNIQQFSDAKILYCKEIDSRYRISIKNDWQIDKNYFYKDSIMIRADKCRVKDR